MNNPVRSLIQRRYEGRLLEALGGRTVNVEVLEIGCGRGVGTEIILQRFGALRVVAFDFDSKMAELARGRLQHFPACRVLISVADAAAIPARDASFDAVFDFGAIHHVPNWRAAVSEVRRVLRPDGRFFFEEVTRHALDRWSYRTFLEHPREDRFTGEEFIAELERHDLMVGSNHRYWFFGDFIVERRGLRRGRRIGGASAQSDLVATADGACQMKNDNQEDHSDYDGNGHVQPW